MSIHSVPKHLADHIRELRFNILIWVARKELFKDDVLKLPECQERLEMFEEELKTLQKSLAKNGIDVSMILLEEETVIYILKHKAMETSWIMDIY